MFSANGKPIWVSQRPGELRFSDVWPGQGGE